MIPEIGPDIKWTDIISQVFHVLAFDRAGTIVIPNGTVKALSSFKPYGYLLVESPILNSPVRMPIVHRDDFLLASSVFEVPQLVKVIEVTELLVTYVPKHKLPGGFAGTSHAIHYVITPKGTLSRYYEFNNAIRFTKPTPEILFGTLVWEGELKVQLNLNPEF